MQGCTERVAKRRFKVFFCRLLCVWFSKVWHFQLYCVVCIGYLMYSIMKALFLFE
jgi:hypothetical protein